jgi:hypothetical protein
VRSILFRRLRRLPREYKPVKPGVTDPFERLGPAGQSSG